MSAVFSNYSVIIHTEYMLKHVVLLHYQFSSESVGLFVVSWNGAELASSQISKCLLSTWGKAGLDSK